MGSLILEYKREKMVGIEQTKKENGWEIGQKIEKKKKKEKRSGRHMISNLVKNVSFRPLEVSIALEERVEGWLMRRV